MVRFQSPCSIIPGITSTTEGVWISGRSIQLADNPFIIHTPTVESFSRSSTEGVWISNGVAHFTSDWLPLSWSISLWAYMVLCHKSSLFSREFVKANNIFGRQISPLYAHKSSVNSCVTLYCLWWISIFLKEKISIIILINRYQELRYQRTGLNIWINELYLCGWGYDKLASNVLWIYHHHWRISMKINGFWTWTTASPCDPILFHTTLQLKVINPRTWADEETSISFLNQETVKSVRTYTVNDSYPAS